MSVGRICTRSVFLASPDESVRTIAHRMHEENVGTLVVVDSQGDPVGIVTDRDLVVRCLAADRDPRETSVESVMSTPVVSVAEATPIEDALARMSGRALRRLVVTDVKGKVAGILALDDVAELLTEEASAIGRLLRQRPAPIRD